MLPAADDIERRIIRNGALMGHKPNARDSQHTLLLVIHDHGEASRASYRVQCRV